MTQHRTGRSRHPDLVAPGYIWTTSACVAFPGQVADKYGITTEQVYQQTAARRTKRLPEPDEIADAVVFLASPMARAITGHTLDVNCGEYHD